MNAATKRVIAANQRAAIYAASRLETRAGGGGAGPVISGYAAVYYDGSPGTEYELFRDGNVRVVERLMEGCFDRAIRERDDVACVLNHKDEHILARTSAGTLTLRADRKGLFFEARCADTEISRNVATWIKRGELAGCSFMFAPESASYAEEGPELEVVEIRSVKLFDVGPVLRPAYSGTSVNVGGDGGRSRPAPDIAWARAVMRLHSITEKEGK